MAVEVQSKRNLQNRLCPTAGGAQNEGLQNVHVSLSQYIQKKIFLCRENHPWTVENKIHSGILLNLQEFACGRQIKYVCKTLSLAIVADCQG